MKTVQREPEQAQYVCTILRDPQKGYQLDSWEEEKAPEGISNDDVLQLITLVHQNGWSALTFPEKRPCWFILVNKGDVPKENDRPESKSTFLWFRLPTERKRKFTARLLLSFLFLILAVGIGCGLGVKIGDYKAECSQNEKIQKLNSQIASLEKDRMQLEKIRGTYENAKPFFMIFEREYVKTFRDASNKSPNFGFISFGESRKRGEGVASISSDSYDQVITFLQSVQVDEK